MKRTFILGDEWLYYKLYCGKRIADTLLVDCIKPLTEKLLSEHLINQWFFIRYSDTDNHLRIRFHTKHTNNLNDIIKWVNSYISGYVKNQLIWKVQTDTYERELERYGTTTITNAEYFFYNDSVSCVQALEKIEDDTLLFLYGIRAINNILDAFELTTADKIVFTKQNAQTFKEEFHADKVLSKQLNINYQKLRGQIEAFMSMEQHDTYAPLLKVLTTQKDYLIPLKQAILNKQNTLNVSVNSLLSSYIHMLVNRLFRDKQRLHELVCYDSLFRFYNYQIAIYD